MKRFIFLLIIVCATLSINAQNYRRSTSQTPKEEEKAYLQQLQGELQQVLNTINYRIEELNRQETTTKVSVPADANEEENDLSAKINEIENLIESLKTEIHSMYLNYREQPLFSDKKFQSESFKGLEKEKADLLIRIKNIKDSIVVLEEKCKWVDRLREHYEKGNVDTLIVQSDLVSLRVHKSILGKNYPKVMDDLQTLLEAEELLTKGYDAKQNQKYIQNLENVQQCERKEYLIGLLQVHKDITDEVNNWMAKEEHTLYSMAVFQNYLINNYGVALDTDYPWLATKIRETVTSTLPKR